jgi:hypothetical protein
MGKRYEDYALNDETLDVSYLDCVADAGGLMREIDALLNKYRGSISRVSELKQHITPYARDKTLASYRQVITGASVRIDLFYDPRILHQRVLPAAPQTELN